MFFGMFLLSFIPPSPVTHTRIFGHNLPVSLLYWNHYLPCFVLRPTSISRPDLGSQSLRPEPFLSRSQAATSAFKALLDHTPSLLSSPSSLLDLGSSCPRRNKSCICRVGRRQKHQDAEELPSLVRNFPGLAIQWPYSLCMDQRT